jgi:hypothetical protein
MNLSNSTKNAIKRSYRSVAKRNEIRKRNYAKGRKHQCKNGKWRSWEIEYLLGSSVTNSDRTISCYMGRSVQAVQIKRCRLKALKITTLDDYKSYISNRKKANCV